MFHYSLFHTPKILTKKYVESVGAALTEIIPIPQKGIVNIIVISPEEMTVLNEVYRGKKGPTDILTFPYRETVEKATDIAGEIYLCLEKIQLYALERETTYTEQLHLIIIHGMVHMMGYDHETKDDAKKMEALEKKILTHLCKKK